MAKLGNQNNKQSRHMTRDTLVQTLTVYYTIQEIIVEQFGNALLLDTPEGEMVKALHNSLANILGVNDSKLKQRQTLATKIQTEVQARLSGGA
tara:strand:- start:422 stop:700 length:279 start_codon:yes stop_codon:yes gene_type:complete